MLSTLPPGSFPTDTMLSTREWYEDEDTKDGGTWKETRKFWNKSKKRFLVSFLFVNVGPLLYFALILLFLENIQFELSVDFLSFFRLVYIPLLASAPFGFYRIYVATLCRFEKQVVDMIPSYATYLKGRDRSPKRHALGSIFYFIWPICFIIYTIVLYVLN
jgi:uncharacterized membrane protein YkvA (DUF1232 family)